MTASLSASTPIKYTLSIVWTIVLVALAIGATTNLFLFGDVVQPYCTATPDETYPTCRPCGLNWNMFGTIDTTPCPNSVVDELLFTFVAIPRLLVIVVGLMWFGSGPLLAMNFFGLSKRWRRGELAVLGKVQTVLLGYILLWAIATALFFLSPLLLQSVLG